MTKCITIIEIINFSWGLSFVGAPCFLEILFPANHLACTEKTKSKSGEATTKMYNKPRLIQRQKTRPQAIRLQEHEYTITHNEPRQKNNPDSVASYDVWPGNGAGLFSNTK